jgi:hypothetical protein
MFAAVAFFMEHGYRYKFFMNQEPVHSLSFCCVALLYTLFAPLHQNATAHHLLSAIHHHPSLAILCN